MKKQLDNPPAVGTYGIDWNNIDLDSEYECSRNLIENLTFDALLLEINCNIKDITEETVNAKFWADVKSRVDEAWEIFQKNRANIVCHARKHREEP